MYTSIKGQLATELDEIRTAGLFKTERSISSPQSSHITAGQIGRPGAGVLNFCANNYLGLADHPDIISAAKASIGTMNSVSLNTLCRSTTCPSRGSVSALARVAAM